MMKFLTFFILMLFSISCYANPEIKNDPERLLKLIKLTDREIKTIRENSYSGPDLKHRLFELYTEKIKLIRERETALMLKEDSATVLKKGKESYYSISTEQYNFTQKFGQSVAIEFPKYKKVAEIYYSLAINSRDFGNNSETENFLKMAIKNSKENNKTMINAKTSLAEYYYNEKKYAQAIEFYNEILKQSNDEWYGKHLYNAAWCNLKEKNALKALSLMKESFETTKNKKYVSMKEQVLSAIGIFYVQADQTLNAITFFEKNTNPSSTYLLMLANSSMNKNNFKETDEVLKAALQDTINRKDNKSEMKVRLTQLDIYREVKKDELFFSTAQNIVDLFKKFPNLPKEDIELSINKIKDVAGYLQINLSKDKKKGLLQYNKDEYHKIIKYFDMLATLDKTNKNQYKYYQGETALSIENYHRAIMYYVSSIKISKKDKKNLEFTKKSLEALLATVEETDISEKLKNEYTIFTYKNYLIFFPTSDKSQALYQKLFNKYFQLKNTKQATNILLVYKNNYPTDDKIHREMLTQLLDYYIKQKNTDMIAAWVNLIDNGFLNFPTEYIQKSIAVLGDLLFDRYHTMEKKGNIKAAMIGYEEIYDSKKYPNKIKAEAAYALAASLVDLNESGKSSKWLKKSLEIYNINDLEKITSSLYVLSKNYRLLQDFKTTIDLSKNILLKFCDKNIEQKDGFYDLYMTTIALEDLNSNKLISAENELSKCNISASIIQRVRSSILDMMILTDKLESSTDYFLASNLSTQSKKQFSNYIRFKFFQNPKLIKPFLEKVALKFQDLKLIEMNSHYEQIIAFREKVFTQNYTFSKLEKFDAEKYNSELEQYLSIINEFTKEALILSKESSPEEIILIRDVISVPYLSLKKAIDAYVPAGVDNKYLQGFKAGMRQVSEPLLSKALQFDKEKTTFLLKNNYFFEIQKHVKFEEKDANVERDFLETHKAFIFTNTMDLSFIDIHSIATGNNIHN
jgi:hypothetical protein